MKHLWIINFTLLLMTSCERPSPATREALAGPERAAAAALWVAPLLDRRLQELQVPHGAEVFLRGFKEEALLELFVRRPHDGSFVRFGSYPIVAASGKLGPKLAEGDRQVPEGFYRIIPAAMKPDSRFHLAMNIGFPNQYDRAHQRTGSFIMIHGGRASTGCLAMSDEKIEEIYTLCDEALSAGQREIQVHLFPFRMSPARMGAARVAPCSDFWSNLQEGYNLFEIQRQPPVVTVVNGRYQFEPTRSSS